MKIASSLLLLAFCLAVVVNGQSEKQLLVTGTLQSSSTQLSFHTLLDADTSAEKIKFSNINFVIFGIESSVFHNHTEYPIKSNECSEKTLREKYPEDAPFFEKQNLALSFTPAVTSDANGNLVLTGEAEANFALLQHLYPTENKCEKEKECDPPVPRSTKVALSLTLSSSAGAFNELQRAVRAGEGDIQTSSWNLAYSVRSKIGGEESIRGFKNFKFANEKFIPTVALEWVIIDRFIPRFSIWRRLKVQPVGIQGAPRKICIPTIPFCICCNYIWVFDTNPTGTKGLNLGKANADTLWRKAGITFDWQPIHYLTNTAFKSLDTSVNEDVTFRNSYEDPTAVEVFFAYEFTPRSYMTGGGGGYANTLGGANVRIVTTETMADECPGVDKTHLAHELGHALSLTHPWVSGANSSPGTLMCGSGWCNDNPVRNSLQNQQNANNPLITYYISAAVQPADDCTNSANCGVC